MEVVAAIDQGTESTKVTFYDRRATRVSTARRKHMQLFPRAGWVEHDPQEIFYQVKAAATEAYNKIRHKRPTIKAIGLATQRETVVVWDKQTGRPLHNAIVWNDTRTDSLVRELKKKLGGREALRETTGLPLNNQFSACKVMWLMKHNKQVQEAVTDGRAYVGTMDSYLLSCLTGRVSSAAVTDVTNAARTLLWDIHDKCYSSKLCDLFGIPSTALPNVVSNVEHFGAVTGTSTCLDGVPICGCIADQSAAAVGQGILSPGGGEVKCDFGTGAFILMNTGDGSPVYSPSGLLTTPVVQLGSDAPILWGLEGVVPTAGMAIDWMINQFGIMKSAEETEELLNAAKDTGGVVFVPAFQNYHTPRYSRSIKGMIMGLTQATKREHIVRALFEAICFEMLEIVECMCRDTSKMHIGGIDKIMVSGGMTRNRPFLQMASDTLQTSIQRGEQEATSLGAAIVAGLGSQFWKHQEVAWLAGRGGEQLHPSIDIMEWQAKCDRWNDVIQRVAGGTESRRTPLLKSPPPELMHPANNTTTNTAAAAADQHKERGRTGSREETWVMDGIDK
ncbi:unnamed protein product [Vitrella brassicaformis CCMP3155]|uniref:glycerol kinase n=1 Tax=Vitrella brassicaformis (strain CCMP3155) TaxID=1169540 RepID=A0A0G4GIZ9_VITBC|nr:unnamed protein product [Vitrella brassicaformis CCMP3155]|eukprot:CEM29800.1 unnamed protein product [Vitrella brassicaformis CCMP3155]